MVGSLKFQEFEWMDGSSYSWSWRPPPERSFLYIRKMRGLKKDVDAARAEFLQKVGYEYVSALTRKSNPIRRKRTPQGSNSQACTVTIDPDSE
jgi:hypothetical protein